MDTYQDSINPQASKSHLDRRRSEDGRSAPTLADVALWKEESARFLHDVREQLNEILAEVDRTLTDDFSTSDDAFPPVASACDGHSGTATEPESDDRISALKARLASKLHNFEETNDRTNQDTPGWEAGK